MALREWNGDAIKSKMQRAAEHGINKVMAVCVVAAKQNHPGWKNITGTAEGSVKIQEFAKQEGNRVVGRWGSIGVNYLIWLELKHGTFLRNAADKLYSTLAFEIRKAFK